MAKNKQVPVYYFGHLLHELAHRQIKVDSWLESQKLSRAALMQADATISVRQFNALLSLVVAQTELQDIGLSIGKRLAIAHHGVFGLGVLNAPTVGDALSFVVRFLPVRIPIAALQMSSDSDYIYISVIQKDWHPRLNRSMCEALILALSNLLSALSLSNGMLIKPSRLEFDYSCPDYIDKYHCFSCDNLQFEQASTRIVLAKQYQAMRLHQVDEFCYQHAYHVCDKDLNELDQRPDPVQFVQYQVGANLSNPPSVCQLAQDLNMSKRSLQRKLVDAGTSYVKILSQARKSKARSLLLKSSMTVAQCGELLGFSDVANFRRAFKSWYGKSPKAFRQDAQNNE